MERSKLTWEEVIKFEEIKGYGQQIWRHNGQYYLVVDEGGIAEQRVVYELPLELFQLLDSGTKTMVDIHYKLQNDEWPSTEEERKASEKKWIEEGLTPLIANPKSREYFTQEELEKLIPLAEQIWIDWKGKLPDNYVSPLDKD